MRALVASVDAKTGGMATAMIDEYGMSAAMYRETWSFILLARVLLAYSGDVMLRAHWLVLWFVLAGIAAVFLVPTYNYFFGPEAVAERQRAKARTQANWIEEEASLTAVSLRAAYDRRAKIGIRDLKDCVRYDGPLLEERLAPIFAKHAMDTRQGYQEKCQGVYSPQACEHLINRALAIQSH